ncbi:MAG: MFS transporter [Burkholderiales bacterium]|nr:MFS transporter [Burkholderiales bacterium]
MNMLLTRWEPDNRIFWEAEGSRVARRNLALSIPPLVLSFAVWMLWSAVVVYLPHVGFRFTTAQLFWLAALPGLAGGTLRLFFAFMVPVVGGRIWTTVSTALLLLPALGIALAVQDPATGYPTFLLLALAAGIGGGNFASNMANLSFFYPTDRKGAALGLNAGLGNLGVGLAQLAVPLVIGGAVFGALSGAPQQFVDGDGVRDVWLQNAGYVWVPLIVLAAAAAWYGMDDIASVRSSFAEQAVIFVRPHTWLLSWLYLGTFGSFIGFSAGLPLFAETQFGASPLAYAFLGPVVGAAARPAGGWLADRFGGARIALGAFIVLASASVLLATALPGEGTGGSYGTFLALAFVLFAASGAGNGAVFNMIPVVFAREREHGAQPGDAEALARARHDGALEGAAAIGFASAIGAFGAFFIPKILGAAISLTGGAQAAAWVFTVFYATCIALTWVAYARRGAAPDRLSRRQP